LVVGVSEQADLPVVERAITRACNFLLIHIYTHCAALRHDGNYIRLVQPGRNGRRSTACQILDIVTSIVQIAREEIPSILAHFKEIEFATVTIGAKDHPTTISVKYLQLHLKSEVAKVGSLRSTDIEEMRFRLSLHLSTHVLIIRPRLLL